MASTGSEDVTPVPIAQLFEKLSSRLEAVENAMMCLLDIARHALGDRAPEELLEQLERVQAALRSPDGVQ